MTSPRFYLLMFTSCALLSCANPYVPPVSGPTAKVRVAIATGELFAYVGIYKNGICQKGENVNIIGLEGRWVEAGQAEPSTLGMLDQSPKPDTRRKERLLLADAPVTIGFSAVGPAQSNYGLATKSCRPAVRFSPEAGKQYEIVFDIRDGRCVLDARELSLGSDGATLRRPIRGAVNDSDEKC